MIKVLDHGFVNLVESWGSEEGIVSAARMSTGKGFLGWGEEVCTQCGHPDREGPCPDGATDRGPCNIQFKPGDEKLLRFLYENHHATPFEMAGMTIEVQAPIFVFREWHRHRTQCLAGNVMITCVSPRGTTYTRSIKRIFDLKYGGVVDHFPVKEKGRTRNGYSKVGTPVTRERRLKDAKRERVRILPNCQGRTLRVLNESSGEFEVAPMADVWESGVKAIWRVETTTGRSVRASADHPFLTERGWIKMKDLREGDKLARMGNVAANERPIPPALRSGIGVWTSMMRTRLIKQPTDNCYLCGACFKFSLLELDHVIPVAENLLRALDETNIRPICVRCHKNKSAAEQPSRTGMMRRGVRWEVVACATETAEAEMTYDIGVEGEHHNFIANGLVVHNSYNEMSARYTPLPDVNYIPSIDRLLTNSKTNKQAGTIRDSEELDPVGAAAVQHAMKVAYDRDEEMYQSFLRGGVPKELARIVLPVGRYSRMRASTDLRNWLAFLTLRMAPGAQWEIRQFANAVGSLIEEAFPRTWVLFQEGMSK